MELTEIPLPLTSNRIIKAVYYHAWFSFETSDSQFPSAGIRHECHCAWEPWTLPITNNEQMVPTALGITVFLLRKTGL